MAETTYTVGLIAETDINWGRGTFTRTDSAGNSATVNKVLRTPQWVNICDPEFGAVGDGSTDCADAIIAAINSVYDKDRGDRTTMGNVYFPPGEYRSSKQIRVPAYVRLIGEGRSVSILRATAAFDYANACADGLKSKQAFVVFGDYDRDESNAALTGTFTADNITTGNPSSTTVTIAMTAHGLLNDDTFYIAAGSIGGPIDGIPASDFNDVEFAVTKVDANSFTIETTTACTSGNTSGSSGDTVTWRATDGQIAFGTGATSLTIHADEANTDSNSVGIYSRRIQEAGGLLHCNASRWGRHALWLQDNTVSNAKLGANTVQNYTVFDCTFGISNLAAIGSASDPPAPVYIDGGAANQRGLMRCSITTAFGTLTLGDGVSAGLRLTKCKSGVHVDNGIENHTYGVLVEGDCEAVTIIGSRGHAGVTDLIRAEAGAKNITCIGLDKLTSTNAIYDGTRASGNEAVDETGFYVIGASGTTRVDDLEVDGDLTLTGNLTSTGSTIFTPIVETTNNFSPSGNKVVHHEMASAATLSSIAAGADGQEITVVFTDVTNLTAVNFNAGNLRCGALVAAHPPTNGRMTCTYDAGATQWDCAINWSPSLIGPEDSYTIATGAITIAAGSENIRVDTESAASSDDLDTITATNCGGGQLIYVQAANSGRTVVLKHGTGNLYCSGAADVSLDNARDVAVFKYDSGDDEWHMVAFSSNGA